MSPPCRAAVGVLRITAHPAPLCRLGCVGWPADALSFTAGRTIAETGTSSRNGWRTGGYTIYAPDLRGHGDSGWAIGGMYSIPEFTLGRGQSSPTGSRGSSRLSATRSAEQSRCSTRASSLSRVKQVVAVEGWGRRRDRGAPAPRRRMRRWIGAYARGRAARRRGGTRAGGRDVADAGGQPALTRRRSPDTSRCTGRSGTPTGRSPGSSTTSPASAPYGYHLDDAMEIWVRSPAPTLLI